MRFKYTQAHLDFIAEKYKLFTIAKVTVMFNEKFGLNKTASNIKCVTHNYKIRAGVSGGSRMGYRKVLLNEEQYEFVKIAYKQHTRIELTSIVNEKYGLSLTVQQLIQFLKNNKVQSGRKGSELVKGRKMSEENKAKLKGGNSTSFKKGNRPNNAHPVGTERNNNGYVEVKTAEPDVWAAKQRIIYQDKFGPIRSDQVIRFIDGNILNFSLDNLFKCSRQSNAYLNKAGFSKAVEEVKPTFIAITQLSDAVRERSQQLTNSEKL